MYNLSADTGDIGCVTASLAVNLPRAQSVDDRLRYSLNGGSGAVLVCVARMAECGQIFFRVVTLLTSLPDMVDLETSQTSTVLASPAVPSEYPLAKSFLYAERKFDSRLPWPHAAHEALSLTCSKNVCLSYLAQIPA